MGMEYELKFRATASQLEQLRGAVTGSKETLRSAADALYAIRPESEEL